MKKITASDSELCSTDVTSENLQQLKTIFPDAFIDGKVDFAVLKELLGDNVDEYEEKYGLTWHGKRQARQLALRPSTGTLRPYRNESLNWDQTKNLLIEGDNLEVLKLLQKSYAQRVKLIYIDPPYNTGNDFLYPDDYRDSIRNYQILTGQIDNGNGSLSSNVETSGRFHTNWLNMIYPRLRLSRNFLREDGVIIISISDAEIHNLRVCCDEVFGQENLIGCIVWNSTKSVTSSALISVSHTYNVVYAKNKDYFVKHRSHFRLPESGEGFSNPDNDERGPWKADPFQVGGERPNQLYTITNPKTGKEYKPNPGNSWKNDYETFQSLLEDNRIVFGVNGDSGPQRKRFLSEAKDRGKVAKTLWDETKALWDDVDTTTNASNYLKKLMDAPVFNNPKPVSLIDRFIQLGAHDPESIVMDFFAGSGTTGHAVLARNIREGQNRKYILVQLPQPLDSQNDSHTAAISFCTDNKIPKNICELTKERLRRAAKEIRDSTASAIGDFGFRVFKLDTSNIRIWNSDCNDLQQALLENVEHIKTDRSDEDLLFELLLKFGFDLCAHIETRTIGNKQVYSINTGKLITCLDKQITCEQVETLALGITEWRDSIEFVGDTAVVFRDSAFADDVAKTNLTTILEQNGIKNVRSI